MKQIKYRNLSIWLLLSFFLLGVGTTNGQTERKAAKAFTQLSKSTALLLLPPEYIYKYNQKTNIIDSLTFNSQQEKEDSLWARSRFIRFIDDPVFLSHFLKAYSGELEAFGFKVFPATESDRFYLHTANAYVINLAQIELDEQYFPFSDTALVGNLVYVFRKQLDALDVNVWFEVSKVKAQHHVLFAESLLTDNLNGGFQMNEITNKLKYLYRIDSLTVKKIYVYATNLGRTYADYTFDYLMNQYIDEHTPINKRSKRYWRYDPYHHRFFMAGEDRLLPIK